MGFNLSDIPDGYTNKTSQAPKESIWEKEVISFSSDFSNKQKENFYVELSILLESGINLKDALELVAQGIKKKKTNGIIQNVIHKLVSGSSLSAGFSTSNYFSTYEIQSIKIGEETGKLPQVINGLADYYKQNNSQRQELISALTYPIIVLISAILVLVFMLNFVVPIFQDLFARNQTDLPWITDMIIGASEFMGKYVYWILGSVIGLMIIVKIVKNKPLFQKWYGTFLLHVPIVNKLIVQTHISRFINAMSLLSSAKVNITTALELVQGMTNFYPLNEALNQINTDLIKGDSQSKAFKKHPKLFDNKLIAMIQVAEQTNQDELVYENLKQRYNNILKQQSKTFTGLMNPLLTLLIGLIVGIILVALYLPMFKMSTLIN
ncbi:type II secretion system F family protein [Nonlabens ulvanivorans]|uniref:type II secretion system F family protein n=1 Tax=Nonlabens ulvanivorans TaxID=906888 RepID=UPI0037C9F214